MTIPLEVSNAIMKCLIAEGTVRFWRETNADGVNRYVMETRTINGSTFNVVESDDMPETTLAKEAVEIPYAEMVAAITRRN